MYYCIVHDNIQQQVCMYYCIVHYINDIQHCQLNAFLLNFICETNPRVVVAVGNTSIVYTDVL